MHRDVTGDLAAAILECFPAAAVVIDHTRVIRAANSRALVALRRRDALFECDRRLQFCCPETDLRFSHLLTFAGEDTSILSVQRTQESGFWILKICRLTGAAAISPASAFVAWLDPSECAPLDRVLVAKLYSLSPTEAKIAAALAEGGDLGCIASELGIRSATARSHLKAIFRKLKVNRQQDLVRLLTQLSAATRGFR
jgi:DNA-binding CsgD family transcriptional regulator